MVGMGMPRQEIWANENLDHIAARAIFSTCGCTMDYIAGKTPACPRWIGNNGFEWLYRLIAEPARLWHRYLVDPGLFSYGWEAHILSLAAPLTDWIGR